VVARTRIEADRIARGYRCWNVPLALFLAGPTAFGLIGLVAAIVGGRPDVVRTTSTALTIGLVGAIGCGYGRLRVRAAFVRAVGVDVAAYREVVTAMARAEAAGFGVREGSGG
jgi:hypothetical protein